MRQPSPSSGGDGLASSSSSKGIAVPAHTLDPTESLCPWPVVFTVQGQEYEIPALPAAQWLRVLMPEDAMLEDVFVELVPQGVQLLLNDDDTWDMADLAQDIIELASGRRWFIAMRVITVMRANWNVVGATMLMKGVDAARLSLSGWLDVALLMLLQHMEQKDTAMFVAQLEIPPEGEETPEEEMVMTAEAFMAMAD